MVKPVGDLNPDINDVQELNLDNLDVECFNDFLDSPLCVPQDPLEGLDWYPNFANNLIPVDNSELQLSSGSNFLPPRDHIVTLEKSQQTLSHIPQVPFHELQNKYLFDQSNPPLSYPMSEIPNRRVPYLKRPIGMLLDQSNFQDQRTPVLYQGNLSKKRVKLSADFVKKPRTKRLCGGAWSKTMADFENLEPGKNFMVSMKKCSHCETVTTPQWRVGPLGPKTLCNACGVRYKSGRLLPEYRPAASPTFDSQKHSNFHKKILKKKGLK